MSPEFSKFVAEAAQIGASGRWRALNETIGRLARNPGSDVWYVQVLGGLTFLIFSEYHLLKEAHAEQQQDHTSLLAWRARNLLELSVWAQYCSKSKENARRLYADAGRDVTDVFSTFQRWGSATAQDTEFIVSLTGAKQDLAGRAASEGIETLDGSYKKVHDAAKECGQEGNYRVAFKLLSKFAHPTAMQMIASADAERSRLQRDCFFGLGCLFFAEAFNVLEGLLLSLAPDTSAAR
jgi:hypothetical protein